MSVLTDLLEGIQAGITELATGPVVQNFINQASVIESTVTTAVGTAAPQLNIGDIKAQVKQYVMDHYPDLASAGEISLAKAIQMIGDIPSLTDGLDQLPVGKLLDQISEAFNG